MTEAEVTEFLAETAPFEQTILCLHFVSFFCGIRHVLTEAEALQPIELRAILNYAFCHFTDKITDIVLHSIQVALHLRPFVRWCNGNTAPFGGVIHGSNPCRTANSRTAIFFNNATHLPGQAGARLRVLFPNPHFVIGS
jgi:hypothetical protein